MPHRRSGKPFGRKRTREISYSHVRSSSERAQ
jgi:hypothetical protein